jgi:Delta7-sterol 5-desaturase
MSDDSIAFTSTILLSMGRKAVTVAVVRYVLMAAPAFAIGYVIFRRAFLARRIQARTPTTAQIVRELGLSLSSSVIFAAIDVTVIICSVKGIMRFQVLEPAPGPLVLAGSVVLLLVLHDTYFYWAHRFLHWGPVFRIAHVAHHRSLNPTPFAAFSFHPIEAVIQYGFVPLIALVAPLHVMALLIFGLVMTALNVYGHGGIELSPRGFVRNPVGRFLLTPTHHDLHHTTVDYNYGFYSSVWDRLMGTNYPGYQAAFERVTGNDVPAAEPHTA